MNKPRPFFSIVTVALNAGSEIAATAESIKTQTEKDIEWIVVDGGSTDDTLEIARKWIDPARDQCISEKDDGVYFAMNKGLEMARGEVVQFLNAGDLFPSNDVLTAVRAAFAPEVDAVYGDSLLSLESGLTVYRRARDLRAGIRRGMPVVHQALFVRRDVHRAFPFDTRYRIAADYAALAALYKADRTLRYLPVALNLNRMESGAVSYRGRMRCIAEYRTIQRSVLGIPAMQAEMAFTTNYAKALVVDVLRRLPTPVAAILPMNVRRRIY